MNTYCIVVPVFNHHHKLAELLAAIALHDIPVIMIDDGSETSSKKKIKQISAQHPRVTLYHLPENLGKGGAVMAGLAHAFEAGYSHAIQVDADYQHNMDDVPKFIEQSEQHPQALICGVPQYDESVNKGRYYARYLTHVWVWINTWSFSIADSMCGFRSYPLHSTMNLLTRKNLGSRMNFDTEVLVRLYWDQVKIINLPTKVIYHEDVPSNFRVFKDNAGITWMHTRLFFGMLLRSPILLYRKLLNSSRQR